MMDQKQGKLTLTLNLDLSSAHLSDTEMYLNMAHQKRYDDLLLHSWWLLKEPFVVLFQRAGVRAV